jgi:IS4 transposase
MHGYRRRIDIGNGQRVLEVFLNPLTEGLQSLKAFQASENALMNRAALFTIHKNVV